MDREELAMIDPIIAQIKTNDANEYCLHPLDKAYPLAVVDTAINVLARVQHTGLQEAIRDVCAVFDIMYTPPEGWNLSAVSAFSFTVVGQRVDVSLTMIRNKAMEHSKIEHDTVNAVIELANRAERIYLCRILGGINVNVPVHRNRDFDFVFTYDGRELSMQGLDQEA